MHEAMDGASYVDQNVKRSIILSQDHVITRLNVSHYHAQYHQYSWDINKRASTCLLYTKNESYLQTAAEKLLIM